MLSNIGFIFSPFSGCYASYIKNSLYLTIATASISSIAYCIIFFFFFYKAGQNIATDTEL